MRVLDRIQWICGHAGRAASVGGMARKPLPSEEELAAQVAEPAAPGSDRPGAKQADAAEPPDDEDEDEGEEDELELELDDDEDEDLVVFTAQEAAGALSTVYAFVKPFLSNYRKLLLFVGLGVVIETLFNVIMPLSLKFLIDDALGEEDFQALIKILSVLGAAGIFTSIVAI